MNEIETKASELQFAKRPKCEMLKMSKSKEYIVFSNFHVTYCFSCIHVDVIYQLVAYNNLHGVFTFLVQTFVQQARSPYDCIYLRVNDYFPMIWPKTKWFVNIW